MQHSPPIPGTLRLIGLLAALMLLGAACAPAEAPSPTPAPAEPEPTVEVEQPTPEPAETPVAEPAFDEDAVADFYRGNAIRIIIGSGPGGTYDIYSRMLAQHMPRHIPGNPTIIVESMAGAGGLIAANAVYNVQPSDGTVIGSFGETFPLRQALGAPGIEFDAAEYQWIGSAISTAIACVARTDSDITSFQDVIDGEPFVVGTMAPGSTIYDTPAIIDAAFGTQMQLVTGYEGVARIVTATEAGEVEGYCASWLAMMSTGRHLELLEDGTLRFVAIMGDRTPDHPLLEGVPALETLATTDEARQLLRAMHAPSEITNPYVVHPDVPSDRVEALREAFWATFTDPDFLAEAEQIGHEFSPSTGERVTQVVQEILDTPPGVLERMREVLLD